MRRTGIAELPLHGGKAPRWLFQRMVKLGREIVRLIIEDNGPEEILSRISDPYWFQSLGCVLGFDWHSSGVTTTVWGALKEGLRDVSGTGLSVAGGKALAWRRTLQGMESAWELTGRGPAPLVRASRLAAKVDSSAVQDGFQVYHHTFLFSVEGSWAVIQQGMNEATGMARRYHWLTPPRFDSEPHAAVAGRGRPGVLNLVA